jgi:hypothetical protein
MDLRRRAGREQAACGGEGGWQCSVRGLHRRCNQAAVIRPRFLPEIRRTEFNYPIAIYGKWHANKYRFLTRFRSDDPGSGEQEFDAPFARLDSVSRDYFDLSWHRHTGEWVRMFERVSLAEALHLIEVEPYFQSC